MENELFGIKDMEVYLVLGILVFFGLLEVISGYLHRTQRTFSDWIQEAGGWLSLALLIKPLIVGLGLPFIASALFPSVQQPLADWNFWLLLPFYLLIDDVLQYWYHRSAHEYEWLWKLHRPHHQAEEMGFFVSYRNAALYYLIMPNIWWVAIMLWLGAGKAVAVGLVLKQLVIIGSHSTVHWDEPLYKSKLFRPVVNFLERIIITPAFHHAHHGKSMLDGVSDPNGNYGNMFSLWDQMFGTASFTQKFPTELGLMKDPKEHWAAAYLYPLVTSNNPESELSRGYIKESTKTLEPAMVHLEKGKKYLWCQCGKSKDQPFCDGTHHGSKFKPLLFEARRDGLVKLCNCKATKKGPFCDNSHVKLIEAESEVEKEIERDII